MWLLGRFADCMRVAEGLSEAFGVWGVVHDRGRLLVHLMLVLAGGGEASTDLKTLRSQRRLFGNVASATTVYRTLTGADEGLSERPTAAMARILERVWAGFPSGGTVILEIDSSVHESRSENKEGRRADLITKGKAVLEPESVSATRVYGLSGAGVDQTRPRPANAEG